jgi:hypothetical protein
MRSSRLTSGLRDAIATHRIRNSFDSSGGAVRHDLRWAVSISRGGACPRTAPSEPPHRAKSARWGPRGGSAKSACHGSRLRARRGGAPNAAAALGCRGGPVRGHPREANMSRSMRLVDVDFDLCRGYFLGTASPPSVRRWTFTTDC